MKFDGISEAVRRGCGTCYSTAVAFGSGGKRWLRRYARQYTWERPMFIKSFSEGEPFRCAGNEFVMLLPRDVTEACEAVLQMVRPGGTTPPNSHETFMQVYLIWSGEARVYIGGEMQQVRAPAVAFVPARTEHWVENSSADQELHY